MKNERTKEISDAPKRLPGLNRDTVRILLSARELRAVRGGYDEPPPPFLFKADKVR